VLVSCFNWAPFFSHLSRFCSVFLSFWQDDNTHHPLHPTLPFERSPVPFYFHDAWTPLVSSPFNSVKIPRCIGPVVLLSPLRLRCFAFRFFVRGPSSLSYRSFDLEFPCLGCSLSICLTLTVFFPRSGAGRTLRFLFPFFFISTILMSFYFSFCAESAFAQRFFLSFFQFFFLVVFQ